MKQTIFASLSYAHKKKQTRREKFLNEMDQVIPWERLCAMIEPHYPKPTPARGGRKPLPLVTKLRVYCLQQFYDLSDPGAEEALYDSESMRRFAGIELCEDAVPDESTILQFRRLLERHQLTQTLFETIKAYLSERGLVIRQSTLVDATIIHAPSSTKNQAGKRDTEMSQTKKNNQWYLGMKAHIGVDGTSGLVHTVVGTTAKAADIRQTEHLLHGEEQVALGDAGYHTSDRTLDSPAPEDGPCIVTQFKKPPGGELSEADRAFNRQLASLRAKVEHPFRVVKRQFGCTKVRYRGLAKNTARLFALFALANVFMARRDLLACAG
ncbi:IS5 family transposase [Algiphilus sp. NNCM1]|uniref:IS5 family transposase n=1 Tax=Algiphilus sp. TaxID=1872431 RepID=UPI001CA60A39|nr:IS5 family transposase [Algiphilus sp.]MBY8965045.1 IS5 family transposase [Algiphilus acroporae]MCI5104199.1 IS5 family transposase [Algiphilus sp.]